MMNFNEIFWMVGARYNVTNWWEIFDSEMFDEVCVEIARLAGIAWTDEDDLLALLMANVNGFANWHDEMAEDL